MPRVSQKSVLDEGFVGPEEQPLLPIEAPRRQRSRIGRKAISGQFDAPIARAFAVLAAREDRTIQDLLLEAVEDLLKKYNQKPIK